MTAPTSSTAPVVQGGAAERLVSSRARMAVWLDQKRADPGRPSLGSWAASAAWPLIRGLGEHPSALLALGALAKGLQRPVPPTPKTVAARPPSETPPAAAATALALVRAHPAVTLALLSVVGGLWWWNHSRARPPQP
jgi:hypothetical protein